MKTIIGLLVLFSSTQSFAGDCTPVDTNRLISGINVHAGISCPADGSLSKFVEVSFPKSPSVKVKLSQQNAAQDSAAFNLVPNNAENGVELSTNDLQACILEVVDRGLTSNQLLDAQQALNDANDPDAATKTFAQQDFMDMCFEATDFSYRP